MSAFDPAKLAADVEAFCTELRPLEELCYVEHKYNDQLPVLAKKHNLLGMNVLPEYGGRGADAVSYFRGLARIGREGTGPRTFFSGHLSIGAYPIQTWGSDALRRKYLPAACRGEQVLAFGLTEPDAGSNPREMTSTYEKKGDYYLLNGVKYLISNGSVANAVVVFAYPRDTSKARRISAFVVDTASAGFVAETLTAKMGMPTSNTAMFEMTDVRVPAENLLGAEGEGFRIAMGTLVSGRLSVAAGCLGVIEDCLTEVIEYSKLRSQHGKPIAKHQLVQDHIAHIEVGRIASDALLIRAAEAKEQSTINPGDAALAAAADGLAARAKFFITNAAWDAADRAVQVFGGRGWSTLYRPGRHLMDVRVCRIYEGTDEILKLKIAANVLGKEYEAFS
ncbi:acyl-CoA dehydrogenase family protein [Fimbriiglobus ruber]|uniref:Butyryl-CoA dehydrogenase n=1 Tax=Fimbriiglobus ruber TaxID=1908690 RepID=A0A225E7J9_9BACT|nr:acyl-CoA dehydrogenase family protein [Fimbriiglobus ruber]OWK46758.1 Butyryl-CoA dehydrogenase [Fimbriiglobus ruber]